MSAELPDTGIRSNVPPRKRFRFALPFFRRAAGQAPPRPGSPGASRARGPAARTPSWTSGRNRASSAGECALEEDLCDREARWDRMYPGR